MCGLFTLRSARQDFRLLLRRSEVMAQQTPPSTVSTRAEERAGSGNDSRKARIRVACLRCQRRKIRVGFQDRCAERISNSYAETLHVPADMQDTVRRLDP